MNRLNLAGLTDRLNFRALNHWLNQQQLRALAAAYEAAQTIQALEEKYYQGQPIAYTPNQSKTLYDYVKSLRDRQLLRVRVNLAQFRIGGFLIDRPSLDPSVATAEPVAQSAAEAELIQMLDFIESVVGKYRDLPEDDPPAQPASREDLPATAATSGAALSDNAAIAKPSAEPLDPAVLESKRTRLPRSNTLFGGFTRVGQALSPDYEQQVVNELRLRRKQTKVALRWILILVLFPIVMQVLAKNLLFEPLLGGYSDRNPTKIELNQEIQAKFFTEFTQYKEYLEIGQLLGFFPEMNQSETREKLEERAVELWRESREEAQDGLKNGLADIVALAAFAGLVYFNRQKLIAVRNLTNWTFLSLNDSFKVFVFIFITDMFVGFHSAEGWDVLVGGLFRHFGLVENPTFINLFVATVPVFMDSCIKFWIFNYFTRFSPSASAIYERMNT